MAKIGQYFYRPHRNMWGIFLCKDCNANEFVKDMPTKAEASREVYRLNGWK